MRVILYQIGCEGVGVLYVLGGREGGFTGVGRGVTYAQTSDLDEPISPSI